MNRLRDQVASFRSLEREYAGEDDRPLGAYAGLLGTYGSVVTALVAVSRLRRGRGPDRLRPAALALLAVATFRASRLITKDSVTAVARAPFTRYREPGAP